MAKKTNAITCTCATCAFATLVRYNQNPLLAECKAKDPEDRQVASTPRACPLYIQDPNPKPIQQRRR